MIKILALLLLCAAYLQGGLDKLLDFAGAVAEMQHFGLPMPQVMAVLVIALELGASLGMVVGIWRKPSGVALALFTLAATMLANRFWELPLGPARMMTENSFFEHLGIAGGLIYAAIRDDAA